MVCCDNNRKMQMKEGLKDSKCEAHSLPIIKIEAQTRRLLCEKCLSESDDERRQRLEFMRIRFNKRFQIELGELRQLKEQTDKLLELFQSKNMTEAKKIINKASADAQKIVEGLLEREVKEANKVLKEAAENELEKWKALDSRNFHPAFLEFEEEAPKLKQSLKAEIADKLKQELRGFYSNLFEF